MVGLGRLELPTYGLGIRLKFLNVFVFKAWSGAELAMQLATRLLSILN
jgi:hypothetical protein